MRILVTGSSGLLGTKLVDFLEAANYEVMRLVRERSSGMKCIVWNPRIGMIPQAELEGFSVVIHLAGSNIAKQRWTATYKRELFQSRCRDTWLLAHALARLKSPPKTFISASAIGFYGNRGEYALTERAPRGSGFLADLCEQWERASDVLRARGTRVVHARLGSVIAVEGGILHYLLPFFRLGLGSVIGNGNQWMSWISSEDAIRAFFHLMLNSTLEGAVNVTAPQSIRNKDFASILAAACKRPLFLRIPAWLLHLFLGEMAQELLLTSQRALPEKLLESGFTFHHPEISRLLTECIVD